LEVRDLLDGLDGNRIDEESLSVLYNYFPEIIAETHTFEDYLYKPYRTAVKLIEGLDRSGTGLLFFNGNKDDIRNMYKRFPEFQKLVQGYQNNKLDYFGRVEHKQSFRDNVLDRFFNFIMILGKLLSLCEEHDISVSVEAKKALKTLKALYEKQKDILYKNPEIRSNYKTASTSLNDLITMIRILWTPN
jgi:hypothetical protein